MEKIKQTDIPDTHAFVFDNNPNENVVAISSVRSWVFVGPTNFSNK